MIRYTVSFDEIKQIRLFGDILEESFEIICGYIEWKKEAGMEYIGPQKRRCALTDIGKKGFAKWSFLREIKRLSTEFQ